MTLGERLQDLSQAQISVLLSVTSEKDLELFFSAICYKPTPEEREDMIYHVIRRPSKELSDEELASVSGGANYELCENKVLESLFPVCSSVCLKSNCRYYRKDEHYSYCSYFGASYKRRG